MEEVLHRGKNRSQGEKFVERPLLVQWEEQTAEASVIYGGQFVTIHLHRSQSLEHIKIYIRLRFDFI